MGLLNKTRCYLVGQIQYGDGRTWREYAEKECAKIGIQCYNPYNKPFMKDIDEHENLQEYLKLCLSRGEFYEVERIMKNVRVYDLNLVDRSDLIFCYINPSIPTFGSIEELVTAVRCKRPTFIAIEGGKRCCPLWLLGMFPEKYIYNNIDEILTTLREINDGKKEIDSDRWRLLREENR